MAGVIDANLSDVSLSRNSLQISVGLTVSLSVICVFFLRRGLHVSHVGNFTLRCVRYLSLGRFLYIVNAYRCSMQAARRCSRSAKFWIVKMLFIFVASICHARTAQKYHTTNCYICHIWHLDFVCIFSLSECLALCALFIFFFFFHSLQSSPFIPSNYFCDDLTMNDGVSLPLRYSKLIFSFVRMRYYLI